MTAPIPPVSLNEYLYRFVTVARWIREDKTIRSDAFMPPADLNLSVTRRLQLTEEEVWQLGHTIAAQVTGTPSAPLPGRAEFRAREAVILNLRVDADPLADNPNHAHISGWPDKPARKMLAQQLAAAARFVEAPRNG